MQRSQAYDLRDQIVTEDRIESTQMYTSDEEHSVLEDDSDGEERDGDYMEEDDDRSSELSIPNESIDFDLVYALHSFAATVEGQANVVKGDSLFLMDDSNSYWWLVRVLKTQEVGYIPAENIETPFERLARLNKHRNVDLASATQAELQEEVHASRDRLQNNLSSRIGFANAPSPTPRTGSSTTGNRRSVYFTAALNVHRYPPAVWNEEEEEEEDIEWDDEGYEDEDPAIAEEFPPSEDPRLAGMEPDDGMSWEDGAAEAMQATRGQPPPSPGVSATSHTSGGVQLAPESPIVSLRPQTSRERLEGGSPTSPGGPRQLDPLAATETRKLTATPTIARDEDRRPGQAAPTPGGPLLPSAVMQQQAEERKRTREEIEALEEAARKKVNIKGGSKSITPSSSSSSDLRPQQGGAKLRKEHRADDSDDGGKKKKGGMLAGLFGRRKDKDKGKAGTGSDRESIGDAGRTSDESGRSSGQHPPAQQEGGGSPVTEAARTQQANLRNTSTDSRRAQTAPQAIPQTGQQQARGGLSTAQASPHDASTLSQHASTLRQRDQQQQALYQQYLNRSPSSPPESQAAQGLGVAAARMGGTPFGSSASSSSGLSASGSRPRPGSLVLTAGVMDGPGVPELSVIRVFAGKNVQTEATFKTVLLNASTRSDELVKQAIQRFRLPSGEDAGDYYLTVKQVEGSSAVLREDENPLVVFDSLVEAAMELPRVKRSSVGSISSIASNLSMHPAIKKLPMNDFTDDSAVKFYLNRRSTAGGDTSMGTDEGDDTIIAEHIAADDSLAGQTLRVPGQSPAQSSVAAERFSSPSYRFPLQVVIYPEDLPDDMVFDPQTEAIVFKHTLRDRRTSNASTASGVSQTQRKKIFKFPKNVTVAEVIELGLERFGILEGVVDGGDDVEDKSGKRQSSLRVRYMLRVNVDGQERELSPSSRVVEAFPRPPTYKAMDKRSNDKRRSVDFALLMGSLDDVQPDDPTFVLRRAVAYRNSSSRHRMSAPLDEIALQHLQRDIAGSSLSSTASGESTSKKPLSKQEVIAAQRAASRANQKAILSAQSNSVRGVDVLLPGNAMLRSQRATVDDRMRYSYVDGTGEMFDISDIVEEEWRGNTKDGDLLEGVMVGGRNKEGLVDLVLSKIKSNPRISLVPSTHSESSTYSTDVDDRPAPTSVARAASPRSTARSPTPTAASQTSTPRMASPTHGGSSSRSATPTARGISPPPQTHGRRPSIASVLATPPTSSPQRPAPSPAVRDRSASAAKAKPPKPIITSDDFGIGNMMAIIELAGLTGQAPPLPPLDPVDAMLFGRDFDLDTLHPDIRDIYSSSFKQLDEMDKILDELLHHSNESSVASI